MYLDLSDPMNYKGLSTEEVGQLIDLINYFLMDYSNFVEENEPYATDAIRRLRYSAHSLPSDDELKRFLLWLDTQ